MADIRQENDRIYIDLWGKTLSFNKNEYALYNLSQAFELKISQDVQCLRENRIHGQMLKVTNEGWTEKGEKTSYAVIPWVWDNIDLISTIIRTTGDFVLKELKDYGVQLNPNWSYINTPWLERVKKIRDILSEANQNAFTSAAQNIANKYQRAYNEELSKDYGLNFGIISSSLTAHLLYAAQSTSKELKDKARAEKFASEITGDPMQQMLMNMFEVLYPLYTESAEPALLQILSEYYAYIVSLFAKELNCSYDEFIVVYDLSSSNSFIVGTSDNPKQKILEALQAYPNNGNVIGYAIKLGVLDDELCEYAKSAHRNFGIIVKNWAISVLGDIYNAGKLFNKPLVTDENRAIIAGLIKYYDYIEDDALGADDWQEILTEVYGKELSDVAVSFEIFDDLKESNANIITYAQANKNLVISDEKIEMFITACKMKDGSCSWYAINMDIDIDQPISVEQVHECIKATNERIKLEKVRLDEQRKIDEEHKAEEQRQNDLTKKRNNKRLLIITASVVAVIIFVTLLTTVIIPDIKYNNAIDLLNSGKLDQAYDIFYDLGNYKDSSEKLISIRLIKTKQQLRHVCVGDYIKFGAYEQDNNTTNGNEDIEWLVLEIKDGKALVISKYALMYKPYDVNAYDQTWASCYLREWLNNDFLNEAFSKDEISMIRTEMVSADKNPEYSTSPGDATQDKVFLLSVTDADKYFKSDNERQCYPTDYAVEKGAWATSSQNRCCWWLRSPGFYQNYAVTVGHDGNIIEYGSKVIDLSTAVRPALWIDISENK